MHLFVSTKNEGWKQIIFDYIQFFKQANVSDTI